MLPKLGWGDERCLTNFGLETCWKLFAWKRESRTETDAILDVRNAT
jgi:hypothetical protein